MFQFDQTTQPICLPSRPNDDNVFKDITKVYSIGYGNGAHDSFSHEQRYFLSRITGFVTRDTFTAISVDGKSRVCKGDSGTGVIGRLRTQVRYVILGVHSYSTGCDIMDEETLAERGIDYQSTSIQYNLDEICSIISLCAPAEAIKNRKGLGDDEDSDWDSSGNTNFMANKFYAIFIILFVFNLQLNKQD